MFRFLSDLFTKNTKRPPFSDDEKKLLEKYVVSDAIPLLEYLFIDYGISLKIVNGRKTKHGDFRTYPNGRTQITVNNTLNKYQFLLTLVHEIAHHVVHVKFGRVQPHGKEWKTVFSHLMQPFLTPKIYPETILPYLFNYFKNPKASTDTDVNLSLALRNFTPKEGKKFIFQIPVNEVFEFRGVSYKRGKKRRTRYECLNLSNNKIYLFNQNAEVDE